VRRGWILAIACLGLCFALLWNSDKTKDVPLDRPLRNSPAMRDGFSFSASLSPLTPAGSIDERKRLSRDERSDSFDFEKTIVKVDLWSALSIETYAKELHSLDPQKVERYFSEALGQALVDRSRLIAVAEAYQGPAMLGFWQKLIQSGSFREHDGFLVQEVYKGIRAVRMLATNDGSARTYLEQIACDPSIHKENLILRKQAYVAISEIDRSASARILRKLDGKDSLLADILPP
jgi:hypothetical protein